MLCALWDDLCTATTVCYINEMILSKVHTYGTARSGLGTYVISDVIRSVGSQRFRTFSPRRHMKVLMQMLRLAIRSYELESTKNAKNARGGITRNE